MSKPPVQDHDRCAVVNEEHLEIIKRHWNDIAIRGSLGFCFCLLWTLVRIKMDTDEDKHDTVIAQNLNRYSDSVKLIRQAVYLCACARARVYVYVLACVCVFY